MLPERAGANYSIAIISSTGIGQAAGYLHRRANGARVDQIGRIRFGLSRCRYRGLRFYIGNAIVDAPPVRIPSCTDVGGLVWPRHICPRCFNCVYRVCIGGAGVLLLLLLPLLISIRGGPAR